MQRSARVKGAVGTHQGSREKGRPEPVIKGEEECSAEGRCGRPVSIRVPVGWQNSRRMRTPLWGTPLVFRREIRCRKKLGVQG